MAHAAAMNPKIFRALREFGMEEKYATRIAEAILPAERIATKEDVADLRADLPAAKDSTPRAKFVAVRADVTAMKTDMETVKSAIVSIDQNTAAIQENLALLHESQAVIKTRLDGFAEHYATKADVFSARNDILRWVVFGYAGIGTLIGSAVVAAIKLL